MPPSPRWFLGPESLVKCHVKNTALLLSSHVLEHAHFMPCASSLSLPAFSLVVLGIESSSLHIPRCTSPLSYILSLTSLASNCFFSISLFSPSSSPSLPHTSFFWGVWGADSHVSQAGFELTMYLALNSLCTSSWPRTHFVSQADLELLTFLPLLPKCEIPNVHYDTKFLPFCLGLSLSWEARSVLSRLPGCVIQLWDEDHVCVP